MAHVVRITDTEDRRGRYLVELDDNSSLKIAGIIAISLWVGQELSTEEIQALKERDFQEHAFERTLNYLSYRSRSESEIRRYLAEKGAEQASDEVIARLKRSGLIDDRAFARQWVENRDQFRPRGRWALQAELRRAGVAQDIIERATSTVDDAESALRAGLRKATQMRALDHQVFRQRLLSFLQRRGYRYDVAEQSVKVLWQQIQSELKDEMLTNGEQPDLITHERN